MLMAQSLRGGTKSRAQSSCLVLTSVCTRLIVVLRGNTPPHWYLGLPSNTNCTPLECNKDISTLNTVLDFHYKHTEDTVIGSLTTATH